MSIRPTPILKKGETFLPREKSSSCIVRQSDDWWTKMVASHTGAATGLAVAEDLIDSTKNPDGVYVGKNGPSACRLHVSTAPFATGAPHRPSGPFPTLIAGFDFLVATACERVSKNSSTIFLATTPQQCLDGAKMATIGDKVLACPSLKQWIPLDMRVFDIQEISKYEKITFVGGHFSFVAAQAASLALSFATQIRCCPDSSWPPCYAGLSEMSIKSAQDHSKSLFTECPQPSAAAPQSSSPWLSRLLAQPGGAFLEVGFSMVGVAPALAAAGWSSLTIEPSAPLCEMAAAQRRGEVLCGVVTPEDGDINDDNHGLKIGQSIDTILRDSDLRFTLIIFNISDLHCLTLSSAESMPDLIQLRQKHMTFGQVVLPSYNNIYSTNTIVVMEKK
jgi:hypothetical protein